MQNLNTDPAITIEHPVMAIHGSAGNASQWQALQQHCTYQGGFYAPEIDGYELTPQLAQRSDNSIRARVQPLLTWLKGQSTKIHVVAHSFGCSIALVLASLAPQRIRSLTFYEPVFPSILTMTSKSEDRELLSELIDLSEIVHANVDKRGMESFINYWCQDAVWLQLPPRTRARMAEQAATVYRDFSQAMNLESGTFSNLPTSIPISTFLGSRTLPVARRMAYLLNELHGSAPVAEIPYLGHMGIFLSPEKVNPLLANVISKH